MKVKKLSPNELYHHGIKGQRWGIRRYQNPDGSLTPQGYVHYGYVKNTKVTKNYTNSELTKKGIDLYLDSNGNLTEFGKKALRESTHKRNNKKSVEKEKAGVYYKDGKDYIKKGSKVTRLANGDEPNDSRRKYVSLTESDIRKYDEGADFFWDPRKSGLYSDRYEVTRDLKVANFDEGFNYIFEKVRDKKVSDFDWKESDSNTSYIVQKMYNKKMSEIEKLYHYTKDREVDDVRKTFIKNEYDPNSNFSDEYISGLRRIVHQATKKIDDKSFNDKMVNDFYKKGYDAMVDMNDGKAYADYPLIIFNPKNSMKRVSHTKIYG